MRVVLQLRQLEAGCRLRRYVRRGVTAEAAAVLPLLLRSEAGTENAECFLPQVMTTTTV